MSLSTLTFGCRLNAAESLAMQARAKEAGVRDAILVNTCAVTAEAVRQAKQAIRRARREHPARRIVVSGCAAQIDPAAFAAMPEVDLVLGNAEKLATTSYMQLLSAPGGDPRVEKVNVGDIFSALAAGQSRDVSVQAGAARTRAFVPVQTGCDHRCTFCIIPYGRGNSRSVPMGTVVDQIRRLAAAGVPEVVLTGVDITAYGADLPGRPQLGMLVRTILKHVPELARLRLSSIDYVETDPALMRALAEEERLMPHLHLSLQSGDDMILKRMKRRHSRADAIRFTAEARRLRPDVVLGADLIAGFPTESEAMFENSLSLVDACGLTFLHVFPFSPRQGTPAARMPQLEPSVVRSRARTLRDRGTAALAERLAGEPGSRRSVLVEKAGFGRTEHYLPVTMRHGRPGEIVTTQITSASGDGLIAGALTDVA